MEFLAARICFEFGEIGLYKEEVHPAVIFSQNTASVA